MVKKYLIYLSAFLVVVIAGLWFTGFFAGFKNAAKVNGTYITKAALDQRTTDLINFYEAITTKLSDKEKTGMRKQTLDLLIYEELTAQEAQKKNITVPDQQVTDELNKQKKGFKGKENKWVEYLKDQGYTEATYRVRTKNRLLYKSLYDLVTKNISDPYKKKMEFDKFMQNSKESSTIKVYEKFE